MKRIALALMASLATPALGAPAPTPAPLVPVTLNAADIQALQNYLVAQPYQFSAPVIALLAQKEAEAQKEADAKKAKP